MSIRPVSIVGTGQIEVVKASPNSLRALGAAAVGLAMEDASVDRVDALFAGNMLADELQGQKHVAALIADHAELYGIEALEVKAATATGAAAVGTAPTAEPRAYTDKPVPILASTAATDRFRIQDRHDPLFLEASFNSAQAAFRRANLNRNDIDLFEAHDAFTIMTCLLLEA